MGKRKIEDMENYSPHFADDLSQEAYAYLQDVATLHRRYIFVERAGKKRTGYCTHCGATFPTVFKHGNTERCPACQSHCRVRAAGISRKYMIDECYMVWYDKSLIDPSAITARGVWCVRDYRRNYRKVKTFTATVAVYVFKPGKAVMFKRGFWYCDRVNDWHNEEGPVIYGFEHAAKVYSLSTAGNHCGRIPGCYSRDSIKKAVEGTPFRFSCWEQYDVADMTTFFALYTVAPCVEYLSKLNMRSLVADKLNGYSTRNTINWRGKTLLSVLRMTKQQFKAIQDSNSRVTFDFLAAYRDVLAHAKDFSPAEAVEITRSIGNYLPEMIKLVELAGTSLRKAATWMKKQEAMKEGDHKFYGMSDVMHTWERYLRECEELGMDITNESVKMPKSLHRAHQNTLTQVKVKANKELEAKLRAQAKLRNKQFRFSYGSLIAYPALTTQELIDEGKALNHCVGSYAQRIADGQCVILFIRKASDLATPFFTMEVREGQVFQCRGLRNCDMTPEVRAFVEAFKSEKLTPKQKRPRQQIQVAAMA